MSTQSGNELVDVIDDDGQTIGVVTRAEMRARRLPHRCTYILVFNSHGELFTHLRTATKDVFPSHWDVTIGGVLATGESFDDCARREAREELGIDVEPERLFPFRYEDASFIVHGMVFRVDHDGPFRLQSAEIVRGEFITLATVAERVPRAPFCPDGLAVLDEYHCRSRREN